MNASQWASLKKQPDKAKKMLSALHMSPAYLKVSWNELDEGDQKKVSKWIDTNGSGWFEKGEPTSTPKGITNVAPKHRKAAAKKKTAGVLRKPIKREKQTLVRTDTKEEAKKEADVSDKDILSKRDTDPYNWGEEIRDIEPAFQRYKEGKRISNYDRQRIYELYGIHRPSIYQDAKKQNTDAVERQEMISRQRGEESRNKIEAKEVPVHIITKEEPTNIPTEQKDIKELNGLMQAGYETTPADLKLKENNKYYSESAEKWFYLIDDRWYVDKPERMNDSDVDYLYHREKTPDDYNEQLSYFKIGHNSSGFGKGLITWYQAHSAKEALEMLKKAHVGGYPTSIQEKTDKEYELSSLESSLIIEKAMLKSDQAAHTHALADKNKAWILNSLDTIKYRKNRIKELEKELAGRL